MMLRDSLYESELLRLSAVDLEKDPPVEAPWTSDLDYARWFRSGPARPLSVYDLRKFYEQLLKKIMQGGGEIFHFAVRQRETGRLLGFMRIDRVVWLHGAAQLALAVGDPEFRGQLEPQVLELALNYAFGELNLYRLAVSVPAWNRTAVSMYESAGFKLEVRQREMVFRENRYWDLLHYGILQEEWSQRLAEVPA